MAVVVVESPAKARTINKYLGPGYTVLASYGDTRVDAYTMRADGTADRGTRRELLAIDQPQPNHNGGNIVTGPDYQNVNAALVKQIRVSRARVDLRLEAFNLFNRTNFDQPDNFLGSPTFGQVLSAQSPRRVQIGARVLF